MQKVIRFRTTFGDLRGCLHDSNINKLAIIEILAPDNIEELEANPYKLTEYIEITTNCFVLNQEVVIKDFDEYKDNTEG